MPIKFKREKLCLKRGIRIIRIMHFMKAFLPKTQELSSGCILALLQAFSLNWCKIRRFEIKQIPFIFPPNAWQRKFIFPQDQMYDSVLILLKPHCAPPVMYLRITVQIQVRACWKKFAFPNYEFGKGQYAFYPVKLSRLGEKKKVCQKYQIFIRRDPYNLGQTPIDH